MVRVLQGTTILVIHGSIFVLVTIKLSQWVQSCSIRIMSEFSWIWLPFSLTICMASLLNYKNLYGLLTKLIRTRIDRETYHTLRIIGTSKSTFIDCSIICSLLLPLYCKEKLGNRSLWPAVETGKQK